MLTFWQSKSVYLCFERRLCLSRSTARDSLATSLSLFYIFVAKVRIEVIYVPRTYVHTCVPKSLSSDYDEEEEAKRARSFFAPSLTLLNSSFCLAGLLHTYVGTFILCMACWPAKTHTRSTYDETFKLTNSNCSLLVRFFFLSRAPPNNFSPSSSH